MYRGVNFTGAFGLITECEKGREGNWGEDWSMNFGELKTGKLVYGGKEFWYSTYYGCLAVDREAIEWINKKSRVVPGRRLPPPDDSEQPDEV